MKPLQICNVIKFMAAKFGSFHKCGIKSALILQHFVPKNYLQSACSHVKTLNFLIPLILHTVAKGVQCDQLSTNIQKNHFKFDKVMKKIKEFD